MASKGNKKYAPAALNSSDLSLGFHCNCSQTCDTIPLSGVSNLLCPNKQPRPNQIQSESGNKMYNRSQA